MTNGGNLEGTRGAGSCAGMGAAPGVPSCKKMCKSLVRWGEAVKGKTASSKIICREMTMLLVERSKTLIVFVINGVFEEGTTSGSEGGGSNLWATCAERLG
jgi:hypothetical protein